MITHSPHTIANRTERIGRFSVPGVLGDFEVRSMKNRKERPVLMVLRSDWENTPTYSKVKPVVEVTIEKNGQMIPVNQASLWHDLKNLNVNFSQRALESFFTQSSHMHQCRQI
ncbi:MULTISPECIES: hypothetical protein [Pectobacterium]|uniref:Uncharacterized protein n=2 Tax=Pectobacterium TaxID=122277 RepID=A0ABX9YXM8_9GAMM|nr:MULTISPECIES: hypothetical protein [Pectobacterium]PLY37037.1 hypothetical protein F164LOC_11275 [Pectobacterium carotovorum]MBE5203488.1 hypothetical protein [Pectobacterium quasiaquaticum]MBE5211719.1 hypothetical protein [Pectobacterium quasiaquaticum]MBE5220474.1 hypothetical protein [Pectobacterium quasiaquaticum]MBN3063434.1 hypothetical protein [Pectobacterium aquaticum]